MNKTKKVTQKIKCVKDALKCIKILYQILINKMRSLMLFINIKKIPTKILLL